LANTQRTRNRHGGVAVRDSKPIGKLGRRRGRRLLQVLIVASGQALNVIAIANIIRCVRNDIGWVRRRFAGSSLTSRYLPMQPKLLDPSNID
jgi:hypothetical protein